METALAPRLFRGLGELPVVEVGAEPAGDKLGLPGTVVVAEPVVGDARAQVTRPGLQDQRAGLRVELVGHLGTK